MRALFPLLSRCSRYVGRRQRRTRGSAPRWRDTPASRFPARRGPEAAPAVGTSPTLQATTVSAPRYSASSTRAGMPCSANRKLSGRMPPSSSPTARRRQDRAVGTAHHHAGAAPFQRKQVHRRRADEAGGKTGRRARIDLCRRCVLLDMAIAQQHDLVGHPHRLGLVMRHVQHGDPQPTLQRQDLAAHVGTKLSIEVRQRFIHQADRCFGNDGAAEGHTLLLAAGKLTGLALQQMSDAENLDRARQPPRALGRRNTARPQPEHDILRDVQMGEQGIGLEHHRHAARRGRQVRHVATGDLDPALGRRLQAGDDPQAGGLAASRRAQQHGEAARRDVDRDAAQRRRHAPSPADLDQPHRRAGRGRGARAEMSRRGA